MITTACANLEQEQVPSLVAEISREKLKKAQEGNPVIGKVREYVTTGQWPHPRGRDQRDVLVREINKLFVNKDGILYRKPAVQAQLVLPVTFHQLIYRELHEENGHLGVEKTLSLI